MFASDGGFVGRALRVGGVVVLEEATFSVGGTRQGKVEHSRDLGRMGLRHNSAKGR